MVVSISFYYGSISFFIAILHNVFLLYHVDVFVNVYKIDKFSFWLGEIIFLLWNSINDPIFGWISDNQYLNSNVHINQFDVVKRRLTALMWNGPLFSIAFFLFWFSWGTPLVQFLVCLCAYDGFLTMIDLHHSALLADLSISSKIRMELNMSCSLFSALASLFVFVSYIIWDKNNYFPFQAFCLIMSLTSFAGFFSSVTLLRKAFTGSALVSAPYQNTKSVTTIDECDGKATMKRFVLQLSRNKNFLLFTIMNLIQVFHCHFNSNFFPLFLSILLGENASPFICSLLLGLSFVAPHINNVYFLFLCKKYGAYKVIQFLFLFKFILSSVMYFCGRNNIWLLAVFIASNRVFTEGTCKLLNLVISDLVDEDFVLNERKQAVSALIFGSLAFFSKPGQTFAPIIGTALLSFYTGQDVFTTRSNADSAEVMAGVDSSYFPLYQEGVFSLLVVVPVLCSVLQLVVWHFFDLHGKHLNFVKSLRLNSKMTSMV